MPVSHRKLLRKRLVSQLDTFVRILCTRDVNVSIAVYYEILKVLNLPADSLLIYVDEAHKKITLPARKGKKHEYKKKRSASSPHQSNQS